MHDKMTARLARSTFNLQNTVTRPPMINVLVLNNQLTSRRPLVLPPIMAQQISLRCTVARLHQSAGRRTSNRWQGCAPAAATPSQLRPR